MSALDLDAISQRSLRVAEASPVEYQWHAHTDVAILLEVDVPALHKEVRRLRAAEAERDELRAKVAAAWDEGHLTPWRRGPDECVCCAWSSGECACGKYGTGELLSLATNPYRAALAATTGEGQR